MADPIVTLETFRLNDDNTDWEYAFRYHIVWRDGYKLRPQAKRLVRLSSALADLRELDLADDQ